MVTTRNTKNRYLLQYRLTCGKCWRAVGAHTTRRDGKTYPYYTCNGRTNYKLSVAEKCELPYFRTDMVDAVIWGWIHDLLTNPTALTEGLHDKQADREQMSKPWRERLGLVDDLIADNQRQLAKLLDLYLTSDFSVDVLTERRTRLEATITALSQERAGLAARIDAQAITDEQIQTVVEFAQDMREGLKLAEDDFEARRQMVERLHLKVTLAVEDGKKVAHVECLAGKEDLPIVPIGTTSCT